MTTFALTVWLRDGSQVHSAGNDPAWFAAADRLDREWLGASPETTFTVWVGGSERQIAASSIDSAELRVGAAS